MKVLLVGSGGREHAIAWKLSQSKRLKKLYIAPGNPGTAQFGENIDIADTNIEELVKFARGADIGLAVIGPEDPLAMGAVDAFEAAGIKAFGPSRAAAQLEADKHFAKEIMRASSIPTAESRSFTSFEDAKAYIASRDEPVVVKAAGLAKGKGVFVCDDPAEGILAAEKIMKDRIFGDAGNTVVVEDKLLGQEASILAFVDGRNIYVMESAQDHKPIGDGDTGPNTGGMGAYSPAPIVTDALMDQIIREILVPTIDGMNRNETPYKGVLYAGLMLTQGGPRVLEFNCRFGDPETQPILMRLKSDLLEVMLAVCDGKLDAVTLQWDERPAVCVVMSSGGYPGGYEKGKVITGLEEAAKLKDVFVFHAGTARKDGAVVTSGGRVLGVTALGETIAQAKMRAYEAVSKIHFEGAYFRRDIADKALRPLGQ
ncbi:MAG TPA: phosphoribosylamine--glycine ligase [Anaerohalosphaeraceae bacterium]|nr:phosphoribosylamine--glycine ligase [Anaerohalosphaeraceae bacterium]HPO70163.1 phosphoribosylamine--glycine ligase [Anaerohalosphaeraceae bacterium]HRS71619.1 phosphoribosylamine--glycine ligase [Anaerohalosphaeraceae bacterium]HRV20771.1 phosphoribosylamine--glycine ligase [Anaerohalosphaeraceae bacterium]